jgi:hypothetical protein
MEAVYKLFNSVAEVDGKILIKDNGTWRELTEEELSQVATVEKEVEYEAYAARVRGAIQEHIDKLAQSYRYDSMASVRGYTGFPSRFQRECMNMSIWAGDCWTKATQIEEEVKAGTRKLPTIEEVINELPAFVEQDYR